MADIVSLSMNERICLAGCIRTVMLSDGGIEETELEDLVTILKRLRFPDYEERLADYEERLAGDEESFDGEDLFYSMAAGITNPAARDVILSVVYELSLRSGIPDRDQGAIFESLNRLWGHEEPARQE